MLDLKLLESKIIERNLNWAHGEPCVGLDFHKLELLGEVGELANNLKKFFRARQGMIGSTTSHEEIADELGDVVITVALVAIATGEKHQLELPPTAGRVESSPDVTDACLVTVMGVMAKHTAKVMLSSDLKDLFFHLYEILAGCAVVASAFHINLGLAVANKFNKTSAKYNFSTQMELPLC